MQSRPQIGAQPTAPEADTALPIPWSEEYVERHTALVARALADPATIRRFAGADELPAGYGVGLDERVVEYPWLLAAQPAGRALDAGSTLNHAHILDRFLPSLDSLTIVTLAPEPVSFPDRGVNYVYADLRELPFDDRSFDVAISLSTLEHVGMDNSLYSPGAGRAADPEADLRRAISELRRVVVPGGRILISVPYGRAEDHGWFRQLDRGDVERMVDAFEADEHELNVFMYTPGGWRRSDLDQASSAAYRDFHADPKPVADHAAAARAVVCVSMRI